MPKTGTITEQWTVSNPAVHGSGGLVATNHYEVSEIGAEVLRAGGNAVDAAVAASFAIGIVEPWNSGLGGCGFMQVFDASNRQVTSIDFLLIRDTPSEEVYVLNMFRMRGSRL